MIRAGASRPAAQHALSVALAEAAPDTIYACFLAIRQTASREPDAATEALLLVVSALVRGCVLGERGGDSVKVTMVRSFFATLLFVGALAVFVWLCALTDGLPLAIVAGALAFAITWAAVHHGMETWK